jgi:hypothetical protein
LFRPRNGRQEYKNVRKGEKVTPRVVRSTNHHHQGSSPPTAETPKPVAKVRSATRMVKGDPYVKKTLSPQTTLARQQQACFLLFRRFL